MSRSNEIIFKHLVGLSICLTLTATHLMAWDITCDAWDYCLVAAAMAFFLAIFVKYK